MEKITDDTFEKIIGQEKPVLIDFYTEWCPPCKILAPIMEALSKEYEDKVVFAKMNIDECPMTATRLQIDRIPTIVLFKNKEAKASFIGFREQEFIKEFIDSNI